jgi:hypothetical protein
LFAFYLYMAPVYCFPLSLSLILIFIYLVLFFYGIPLKWSARTIALSLSSSLFLAMSARVGRGPIRRFLSHSTHFGCSSLSLSLYSIIGCMSINV